MKRCARCRETKPIACFSVLKSKNNNIDCYCKKCRLIHAQRWQKLNTEKHKAYVSGQGRKVQAERVRFVKYGMQAGDFDELEKNQGGVCAICKKAARLCVDHCHETGVVRGLLCDLCNRAVGGFRNDSAVARAAADYIEFHNDPNNSDYPIPKAAIVVATQSPVDNISK